MKKKTLKSLDKKLLAYVASAGVALSAVNAAQADVSQSAAPDLPELSVNSSALSHSWNINGGANDEIKSRFITINAESTTSYYKLGLPGDGSPTFSRKWKF